MQKIPIFKNQYQLIHGEVQTLISKQKFQKHMLKIITIPNAHCALRPLAGATNTENETVVVHT